MASILGLWREDCVNGGIAGRAQKLDLRRAESRHGRGNGAALRGEKFRDRLAGPLRHARFRPASRAGDEPAFPSGIELKPRLADVAVEFDLHGKNAGRQNRDAAGILAGPGEKRGHRDDAPTRRAFHHPAREVGSDFQGHSADGTVKAKVGHGFVAPREAAVAVFWKLDVEMLSHH